MEILFEEDHWDLPLSGLAYHNGELVWYSCHEAFQADWNTGERLETEEVIRRAREYDNIVLNKMEPTDDWDNPVFVKEIEAVEFYETRIYAIHKLSRFDKIRLLAGKRLFEIMVGTHWSYDKRDHNGDIMSFMMNRWAGIGKVLFHLYYGSDFLRQFLNRDKRSYERDFSKNTVIDFIRYEDVIYYGQTNDS